MLGVAFRGTLGLLLDAKRAGLVTAVEPLLDRFMLLGFRLGADTKCNVLELAGESP